MAVLRNGFMGSCRGKIGNLVFYNRNGENLVRKRSKITKPPSEKQLESRMAMSLVVSFLSPLLEFIRVSFKEVSQGTTKSPYNIAVSSNRKDALYGTYPDLKIDYEKVIVGKGKLWMVSNPTVTIVPEGLKFDWLNVEDIPWEQENDQLMAVAYFPLLGTASYLIFGAERKKCTDVLPLANDMLDAYMEVYISFVSADRKYNSDSQYLGSLNK